MTATPDGFEFFIQLRDEFSGIASKVTQSIEALSSEIGQLREAQKQLADASRKATQQAKKQADASDKAAKAKDKDAKATGKLSREEQRHFNALQRIDKAQEEVATQEKVIAEAKDINRIATRKKLRILTQEQQGLLAARSAVRAKLAEDRRTIAVAKAEEAASRKKTRQLAIEAEATTRLARIKRRAAVEARVQALAEQQGIDPRTGQARAAELTEAQRVEQEARKRFEKELHALKVKNQQELFRRQSEEFQRLRGEQRVARTSPRARQAAQLTAEQRAQVQINREKERAQQRLEFERLKRLDPVYQQLQRRVASVTGEKRRLVDSLKNLNNRANRVSFTFRRLFGILALFTASRAAISGFNQLVRGSVEFNSTLEQAELGIRSILVAVGGVTDIFGGAVGKVEQFQIATGIASDQIAKLRVDAQKTAATFEQLVTTFQVAIAPGITAGLNVDQIREFTIRISQAAGALGVQQNQLVEEIRSILEGTIQKRTTRIASALGITNQDIERAKELGVLSEFLQDRFQAFALAGEEALGTFSAILTNTVDAFALLVGTAGEGYFQSIKALLEEIRQAATDTSLDGAITPNPQALQIVRQVFVGLQGVVDQAGQLKDSLTFEELAGVARTLGTLISAIGSGLLGAARGVLQAFERLRSIASAIFESFTDATDISEFNRSITRTVAITTDLILSWVTLSGVFGIALKGIRAVSLITAGLWVVMGSGPAIMAAIRKGIAALRAPTAIFAALASIPQVTFLATLAVIGLLLASLQQFYSEITGKNITLVTTFRLTWLLVVAAFESAKAGIIFGLEAIVITLEVAFKGVLTLLYNTVGRIVEKILDGLSLVSDTAGEAAEALRKARIEAGVALDKSAEKYAEAADKLQKKKSDIENDLFVDSLPVIAENEQTTFENLFKGVLDSFELPKIDISGLGEATEEIRTLRNVFEQFTGLIGKANADLDVSAEKLKELQDESRDLGNQFVQALGGEAVSSNAQRVVQTITQARIQQAETLFEIDNKITNNSRIQEQLEKRRVELSSKLNNLKAEDQRLVNFLLRDLQEYNELQTKRVSLANEVKLIELERQKAEREGNEEQIAAIKKREAAEKKSLEVVENSIAAILRGLESVDIAKLSPEDKAVIDLFKEQVELQAQSNLAAREGNLLAENRAATLRLINQNLAARLAILREEGAFTRQQELLAAQRAAALARVEELSETLAGTELQQLVQASARAVQARNELSTLEDRAAQDVRILRLKQSQTEDADVRKLIEEEILQLQKQQALEIQTAQSTVAAANERLLQARETFGLNDVLQQQQVLQTRLEASSQRLVNLAEDSTSQAILSYAERQKEAALAQTQLAFAQQEASIRLALQERRLQKLREEEAPTATIALLERDIQQSKARQSAEQDVLNAKLDQARLKLERARLVLEGTFTEGLQQGLRQWANNLPTAFERGVQVMTTIAQNFSTFVSSLIVDAFDPTQDVDFEERLGRFFQGIAQAASQALIDGILQQLLAEKVVGEATQQAATLTLVDQAVAAADIWTNASAEVVQNLAAAGPQLTQGFVDGARQLTDTAASTLNTTIQSAQQAAGGLSQAFSAAAGPISTLSSAGTLFSTTVIPGLNGAAAAILAAAKALALAAAKAAVGGAVGAAGGGASTVPFASGGSVPMRTSMRHRGRPLSHSSRGVRGFASGGRPAWVPLSDTIPAWLTPGEWVMRLGAVRTYGANVMDAINSGLVDPNALRALAASARGNKVRKPSYPAFAEGGLATSEQYQRTQTATNAAAPTRSVSTTPILAMDNRLVDQFLAAGGSGMLRWMRENKAAIQSAISDERGTR